MRPQGVLIALLLGWVGATQAFVPAGIPRLGAENVQLPAIEPLVPVDSCDPQDQTQLWIGQVFPHYPPSPWEEGRRKAYRDALSTREADVLVVPFQASARALDRVARSLLTRQLVDALRARGLRVLDPDMVERALWIKGRNIDRSEVRELAQATGVTTILIGNAGWVGSPADAGEGERGRLCIGIELYQDEDARWEHLRLADNVDWTDLPFGDVELPYLAAQPVLEAFADAVTGERRRVDPPADMGLWEALPVSPLAMIDSTQRDPLREAFALQLLGVLQAHMPGVDHVTAEGEQLFERSLIHARRLPSGHPWRALLEARALLYLHRRPAAAARLQQPTTAEEQALRAFIDGNLPSLRARVKSLPAGVPRFLAELELIQTRMQYGDITDAELRAFIRARPGWALALRELLWRYDRWKRVSNTQVFEVLGEAFPELMPIVQRLGAASPKIQWWLQALTGEESRQRGELAPENAFRDALAADEKYLNGTDQVIGRFDYLATLAGYGVFNLLQQIDFEIEILGDLERGLATAERVKPVLAGHPYLEYLLASAYNDLLDTVSGATRKGYSDRRYQGVLNAVLWSGGQSRSSDWARGWVAGWAPGKPGGVIDIGAPWRLDAGVIKSLGRLYDDQFPRRWFWGWDDDLSYADKVSRRMTSLAYANLDAYVLEDAYEIVADPVASQRNGGPDWVFPESVLEIAEQRFQGSEVRASFLATRRINEGDWAGAEALLRADLPSPSWSRYEDYATVLLMQGKVTEAAEVFRQYPEFDHPESRVGAANNCYNAAETLLGFGDLDDGSEFMRRCITYHSGSAREYLAKLWLLENAARFDQAVGVARRILDRYPSDDGHADLVVALALAGAEDEAELFALTGMDSYGKDPKLWDARLIAQRLQGLDHAAVLADVRDLHMPKPSSSYRSMAARHAFRALTMDRAPQRGVGTVINALVPDLELHQDARGWIINRANQVVGPAQYQNRLFEADPDRGLPREHELAMFAPAYSAWLAHDYSRARKFLMARADYYHYLLGVHGGYALPYLAMVEMAEGHGGEFEIYLDTTWRDRLGDKKLSTGDLAWFPYYLARAVVHAGKGEHDAALAAIEQAFLWSHSGEGLPISPGYSLLEIVERLWQDTGVVGYREKLLELARIERVAVPYESWPHVFLARYGQGEERQTALAWALWLDPLSWRLREVDAGERAAARERLQRDFDERRKHSPVVPKPAPQRRLLIEKQASL